MRLEKYEIHIGDRFEQHFCNIEIAPGQYVDYDVTLVCGITTSEKIIGVYDTPRFFPDAGHFNARIVWFTTGFVEYEISDYIP